MPPVNGSCFGAVAVADGVAVAVLLEAVDVVGVPTWEELELLVVEVVALEHAVAVSVSATAPTTIARRFLLRSMRAGTCCSSVELTSPTLPAADGRSPTPVRGRSADRNFVGEAASV